jgi:hypothetical protein
VRDGSKVGGEGSYSSENRGAKQDLSSRSEGPKSQVIKWPRTFQLEGPSWRTVSVSGLSARSEGPQSQAIIWPRTFQLEEPS